MFSPLLQTAHAVSPRLAGALALRAFADPRPRMPLRDDQRATAAAAGHAPLLVRGRRISTYEWGTGDDTVLLVHGWRGRALQFAPLVRDLVADGCHVVAFDAPGHGASPGRRTDIRDWVAAIEGLQRRHGRFRMIAAHSFGVLAALTAVRGGTVARRVAAVAGTGTPQTFLDAFTAAAGLNGAARESFESQFRGRLGESADSMVRRYDAIIDPLPRETELLVVHDEGDRQLSVQAGVALATAHGSRARLIRTTGLGHSRILDADITLDAVAAFAADGVAAIDRMRAAAD